MPQEFTESSIRIRLCPDGPIDLFKFTTGLRAMGSNFSSFARDNGAQAGRLCLKGVDKGSVLIDLVATMAAVTPAITSAVQDYVPYLKTLYDKLINGRKDEVSPKEAAEFKNIAGINVGENSKMEISAIADNGSVINNGVMILTGAQCARVASMVGSARPEDCETPRLMQLLVFTQVKKEGGRIGGRGRIENIFPKPLPIVFINDTGELLEGEENPLTRGYHVDVVVQTNNGAPACYKLLKVHGSIDIDEEGL